MAKNFTIVVNGNDDEQPFDSSPDSLQEFANYLMGSIGGTRLGSVTYTIRQTAVPATGTVTLSTASGTLTATINGVAITATASGGDTNSAALLAAAINASSNALVTHHVSASSSGAVVTITAKVPGYVGNAITLAGSGTGVTASGARLTNGSNDANITYTL
jgi:phage tail sheath gpL-like